MGITDNRLARALFITHRAANEAASRYISKRVKHEICSARQGNDRGFEVLLFNADGSYLGHIGLET